jgi:ABC-2 type transport system ATP-binding protein
MDPGGVSDPAPVALEALGLTKQYWRGATALSDVSLSVARGSITALIGPNAAGKSTLIRTWVGFARPTPGSVRVAGIDPWRDRASALRHLGYVPQQPVLYRGLSVSEHLDLAAHLRSGFDRAGAARHLDELPIPLRARADKLSGGQQAQVLLALALGSPADVLVLDEPLASLDPLARSEFLYLLRARVRERGATALLSSHIVTDVAAVCDRIIVLGIGRVLFDDSLARALAQHVLRVGVQPGLPGATDVGTFPNDAGELLTLVRLPHDVRGVAQGDARNLRQATIEDVVKGYLVAGRRGLPERAT